MLTESLNIYVIDKDGNKVTFPNVEGMQPAIVDVNLNRERMAGAPTNTSTLMYPVCLDSYWTKKEFIEIGSERYYVKQVPTSEKNIEDTRYKHEITFVSERDILENVFFFDCVTQDPTSQVSDKPRSNTTDFSFYGDLEELVQRLNDSLSYSKIYDPKGENGFCIVIDDDVEIGEAKEVSMTDAYFATAMQEIYNVFEVPYYWVGKVCHVGYQENEITEPFEYGSGNGLISVQKTNAEFRLINRITGQGSADNIPYYYPNSDPNGTAIFETENFDKSLVSQISLAKVFQYTTDIYGLDIILCKNKQETYSANLLDFDNYLTKVKDAQFSDQRGEFTFDGVSIDIAPKVTELTFRGFYGNYSYKREASGGHGSNATRRIGTTFMWCYLVYDMNAIGTKSKIDFSNIQFVAKINKAYKGNGSDSVTSTAIPDVAFSYDYAYYIGGLEVPMSKEDVMDKIKNSLDGKEWNSQMFFGASIDGMNSFTNSSSRDCEFIMSQKHSILIECCVTCDFKNAKDIVLDVSIEPQGELSFLYDAGEQMFIALPSGKTKPLSESGITITKTDNIPFANVDYKYDGENWLASDLISASSNAAKIKILGRDFINPISKLMPSIFRSTKGSERFYNAENETYLDENGNFYSFNNPYVPSEPLEGKQDFEDIKPTINGITNENGELFGEIAAVAFDDTDSDDLSVKDASDPNTNTATPVHPYFYVKLHKFSGENGFNLFKQGLAQGAMTFNFITGSCAGCSFKVKVSEGKQVDNHYEFKNEVQVDEQGNIVAGDSGDKIKDGKDIASQQDTMTNSVWIALEKDNSTFGVLMPNATNNYRPQGKTELREGDKFVITNILLPTQYITAAEKRLDAALVKYMSENNDEKFTFSIKFSRIYLQKHPEIAEKINENTKLHVKYNNVDYPLFVSSYSRKSDDNILDEISVELSERLTIAQNKSKEQMDSIMGNVNEQINSAIQDNNINTSQGVSSNDINSLKALLGNKLSRVSDDTAAGIITFLRGTYWGKFTSGTGAAMTVDPITGQTYMEVDRLKVRLKAFFEQLEVQKVGYVGGKLIVTKGQGVDILDVENIYDSEGNVSAYRCYFLGEQEGRKIDNLLRVKDQMICKDFNVSEGTTDGATNKYYWRLATAVSSDVVKRGNNVCHWVDLSATDCDTNSDIPEIGDTICHLGNREDTDRQGAEILSVVDANSPSFTIYSGINSYSLVNKEYIDMGVVNGKAYCNIYGSTYIGDRERKSGYLRWNDNKKTFEIKGTIDITSPLSSGGTTLGDAIDDAANAYKGEFDTFTSNVNEVIGGFQAQIDGVIETWFYEPEPTLGNEPAVNWTDNATKDKHLGDLYYSGEGLAYRFQKEGDNYVWKQIDDTAITKALAEAKAANDAANAAQGTADSKMRVFVVQPTADDEYSVGDMWVNATYPADGIQYENDILKCKTPKSKGEAFSIDHWEKASKYTDDTVAKEAKKAADDANTSVTKLGNKVSGIYDLTDEAFKDRVIDKTERDSLQKVLADLEQDWADVASSYSKLTENSLYDSIAADVRTNFKSAYVKLEATYKSFKTAVENVISATQVTDSLINGLYNNYENFKTDYAAYVSIMTVVTKQIDAILNKSVSDLVTELGGYKYLKKATAENNTLIEGGLILSTLIGLGYTDTNKLFHVMSGMSGIYDTQKTGNGIAFWAGGSMVDKQYDASDNPAQFLVRHDGTGYAAGGNLWWEKNGKVHADPMSFVVGEDNLKNLLGLFRPIYSGGTGYEYITGVEPQFQFTKLRVTGGNITNGELIGGLQIGDTAKFYVKDGVLFLEGDLAVTGGITMYASNGVTSGMIDQVYAVLDPTIFSKQGDYITIKGDIGGGTVKAVKVGSTQYDPDSNGIISLPDYPTTTTLEWDNILNKPSSFTPAAHTHAISEVTNLQTTLDGKAAASHTHSYAGSASAGGAAYSANKINSLGNLTAYEEGSTTMGKSGVNLYTVYDNGYPVRFGNLLHINGGGAGQLLAEWCGNSTLGHIYYRSKRDMSTNGWSAWGKVAFTTDNVASASKWQTARKITLTGSVTGSVSIDGSGDVTLATTTNHTHSYLPLSGGTMSNTNVVTNLNADLLDGNHASAFAAASHTHSYLPLSGGVISNNSRDLLLLKNSDSQGQSALWLGGEFEVFTHGGIVTYSGYTGGMYLSNYAAYTNNGSGIASIRITSDNKVQCGDISWTYAYDMLHTGNYSSYALSLSGGTMNSGARISHADGNLYLGRSDNNGWVMCQDMCSQNAAGDAYWSLRTDGTFHAKNTTISGTCDIRSQATFGGSGLVTHKIMCYPDSYFGLVIRMQTNGCVSLQSQREANDSEVFPLSLNSLGGKVGIGTTSPSEKLHVVGNILASGGITMYSDLRKKNILSNEVLSVKEIAAAPLFRHTYKSDDNQYIHVGTSAQYWSGIHEDWFTRKDGEGYYQMELQNLGVAMGISLAREIVKYESKTDKKIRLMKKRINELEARVKELEERRTA